MYVSVRPALRHHRLGIIGLGQVGMRVGRLVAAFGMHVSAFDPYIMVVAPSGEKKENDDFNDSKSHSRIEAASSRTRCYFARGAARVWRSGV